MATNIHSSPSMLKVYETGELTVIGFDGDVVPDEAGIAECRESLLRLVEKHGCRFLAVDLSGIRLLPSSMLWLLLSAKRHVEKVELFNPSPEVRDVLSTTNLDQVLEVRELEPPVT